MQTLTQGLGTGAVEGAAEGAGGGARVAGSGMGSRVAAGTYWSGTAGGGVGNTAWGEEPLGTVGTAPGVAGRDMWAGGGPSLGTDVQLAVVV